MKVETAKDFINNAKTDKKSKKIALIIGLFIAFIIASYFSGIYSVLTTRDINEPLNLSPLYVILKGFTTKAGIMAFIFLAISIIFLTAMFLMYTKHREKIDDVLPTPSIKNTYGASHMEKEKDYKKYLALADNFSECETKGYVIGRSEESGKLVVIPKSGVNNRNMAICGSQGTFKSLAIMRNLMISAGLMGHSVIVTDPKGELTRDSYTYFRDELHYKNIWQFNLINQINSNGWDILGEIKSGSIDVLCDTIIANTRPQDKHDFFDDIETLLLKALMLYVYETYPEKDKNIGSVYALLEYKTLDDLDTLFFEVKRNNPQTKAAAPYNMFSNSPNKANAFLGLGARMRVFADDVIKQITGVAEIDLEKVAEEKSIIYCILPDTNKTYNVIIASFITLLFARIFEYGKTQDSGKCKVPVDLILDEFPSCGFIPDFGTRLSVARSYDIGVMFVFQNIPQMWKLFGKEETGHFMSSCCYNILLGCQDEDTAKVYSALSGTMTVDVETVKKKLKTFRVTDYTPNIDQSEGSGKRPVLMPDDIRHLPDEKLLIFMKGKNVIKLNKVPFYELEEAATFKKLNANKILPDWMVVDGKNKITGADYDLDELIKTASYVVTDSEEYGPQRTTLVERCNKLANKYKTYTPNGMPVIINGTHKVIEESISKETKENISKEILSDEIDKMAMKDFEEALAEEVLKDIDKDESINENIDENIINANIIDANIDTDFNINKDIPREIPVPVSKPKKTADDVFEKEVNQEQLSEEAIRNLIQSEIKEQMQTQLSGFMTEIKGLIQPQQKLQPKPQPKPQSKPQAKSNAPVSIDDILNHVKR